MSREVPYNPKEKCDICGDVGAFDFMGDLICSECLSKNENDNADFYIEVDDEQTEQKPKTS